MCELHFVQHFTVHIVVHLHILPNNKPHLTRFARSVALVVQQIVQLHHSFHHKFKKVGHLGGGSSVLAKEKQRNERQMGPLTHKCTIISHISRRIALLGRILSRPTLIL